MRGKRLGKQGLAGFRQADDLAAAVAAVRDALDPAAIGQAVDHAGKRALGDERLVAQLGGGHARRVAQRGNDVELRRRQPQRADMRGGIGFERLVALHQGLYGRQEVGWLGHRALI